MTSEKYICDTEDGFIFFDPDTEQRSPKNIALSFQGFYNAYHRQIASYEKISEVVLHKTRDGLSKQSTKRRFVIIGTDNGFWWSLENYPEDGITIQRSANYNTLTRIYRTKQRDVIVTETEGVSLSSNWLRCLSSLLDWEDITCGDTSLELSRTDLCFRVFIHRWLKKQLSPTHETVDEGHSFIKTYLVEKTVETLVIKSLEQKRLIKENIDSIKLQGKIIIYLFVFACLSCVYFTTLIFF